MKIFEDEMAYIPSDYLMMDVRNVGPESPEEDDDIDLNDPDRANDDESSSQGMGEDEGLDDDHASEFDIDESTGYFI